MFFVFLFWFGYCLTFGKQFFSNVGTEPLLPGYLPVLLASLSVLLKDTKRWALGLNPGHFALESGKNAKCNNQELIQ